MLYPVTEVRLRPAQTPDFKRRVEFADSARVLINTGEYAHPPLEEIIANTDLFANELRGPIRDKSRQLLAEI